MDYLIRATAANGQIRAFAATTRDLCEEARGIHNLSPVATAALGRLLTAGAMMGPMMKGEKDLLTLQIIADGPIGGLTVSADAQANVKGYVGRPDVMLPATGAGKLDVGGAVGKGMLRVIRDLGLKEPYIGETDLQTGEIGDDLTYYFATSEQTPSSVGLGVLLEREGEKPGAVRCAGGFLIQLMPDVSEETVAGLEEKLAGVQSVTAMLDAGMTPEKILDALLGEFGLSINEKQPARYRCDCSVERIERVLVSLGEDELSDMIAEGQPVEVGCEFCGKRYSFSVDDLRALLERAQK